MPHDTASVFLDLIPVIAADELEWSKLIAMYPHAGPTKGNKKAGVEYRRSIDKAIEKLKVIHDNDTKDDAVEINPAEIGNIMRGMLKDG